MKIFEVKRKKQGHWSHFVVEVDVKARGYFAEAVSFSEAFRISWFIWQGILNQL